MTNTKIKFIGILEGDHKEAATMMRIKPEEILALDKEEKVFGDFMVTAGQAIKVGRVVRVPYGVIDSQPIISIDGYEINQQKNREKYCKNKKYKAKTEENNFKSEEIVEKEREQKKEEVVVEKRKKRKLGKVKKMT